MAYQHILVTGGTGSVGGEVLIRMLRELRPDRVTLLMRGSGREEVVARLAALRVALLRRSPGLPVESLTAVRGDVGEESLGLGQATRDALAREVDAIVHSAADTRLDQSRESAQRTNHRGTVGVLRFAAGCGRLRRLVHLSTAYVSGTRSGRIREEELDCGQSFLNHYERSKFDAEVAVRRRMADLPIVVARPSIVVGDSRDGHAFSSPAVLPVLRSVASGRLRTFPGWGSTRLDLVPVDYVADAVALLLVEPEAIGRTFHLTAGVGGAIRAERLFEITIREVGRHPDRTLRFSGRPPSRSKVVRGRMRRLTPYLSYLLHNKAFDTSGFRRLAGDRVPACPAPSRYLPVFLRAAFHGLPARTPVGAGSRGRVETAASDSR